MLVEFGDGKRYVCAGDAAYTLQAVREHQPTGRPFDADAARHSLQRLTALDAHVLTAHDVDQWREVADCTLLHSA
jgi:glyoxylase-like metal-dependent hydrolase (beta-lactamase superfamily II)